MGGYVPRRAIVRVCTSNHAQSVWVHTESIGFLQALEEHITDKVEFVNTAGQTHPSGTG